LLPLYPFFVLGIVDSIARYSEKSKIARFTIWSLIWCSVAAFPLYFTVIQPITHPLEDSHIVFAKDVLRATEQDAKLYCVKCDETLALVGQRCDRVIRLPVNSSASQILHRPVSPSYLITDKKNMEVLLEAAGTFPHKLVFTGIVNGKKLLVFRLTGMMPDSTGFRK
jgi:hypothetical protein